MSHASLFWGFAGNAAVFATDFDTAFATECVPVLTETSVLIAFFTVFGFSGTFSFCGGSVRCLVLRCVIGSSALRFTAGLDAITVFFVSANFAIRLGSFKRDSIDKICNQLTRIMFNRNNRKIHCYQRYQRMLFMAIRSLSLNLARFSTQTH